MTQRSGSVVAGVAAAVVVVALVGLGMLAGLPAVLVGSLLVAATVLGLRTLVPNIPASAAASAAPLAVAGAVETGVTGHGIADHAPAESVSHEQARAAAVEAPRSSEEVAVLPEGPIGPEHDPATGLWSRAALERALAVAVREESWSYPGRVVMFVVFDDFNTIVDEHGREVGREVFAAAAQRLMACLRPGDIAVRHGIDGFVILLERNASMSTARPVAERVIMAMAFPFMVGEQFLAMGACVGLTVSNGDLTPDGLLLTGIGAASIAKRAGRGHIIQVT